MKVLSLRGLILSLFVLYMLIGAMPRFISFGDSENTFPITEVLLYMVCMVGLLTMPRAASYTIRASWLFCVALTFSALYGITLNGAQLKPLLMNVRLQIQIVSAVFVGYMIWQTYGRHHQEVLRTIVQLYLAVSILSLLILAAFPDSLDLYNVFASLGIPYLADPHVWRLISPYLDPNLFAAIILLPLLFAIAVRMWLPALIMTVALILTVSRSGIGVAIGVFGLIAVYAMAKIIFHGRVKASHLRRAPYLFAIAASVGVALWVAFGDMIMARLETPVTEEGSALMRLESFQIGLMVMQDYPLFGIGFNYGIVTAAERTLVSEHQGVQVGFDSSVQTALINFGAIPVVFLALWFWRWAAQTWRNIGEARLHFALLVLYILVTALITSAVNNILFYQFWLIPVVALCTYFSLLSSSWTRSERMPC